MWLENFALGLGTRKPGLWTKSGLSLLNWRTMGGREGGRGKKNKAETTHSLQNLRHLLSDSWYQMFSALTLDSLLMVSSRLWHHHIRSTLCTYIMNQVFVYSWSLYKYLQIKSKTYTHSQWNIIQSQKGMKRWHMLQHRWILKTLLRSHIQKDKYCDSTYVKSLDMQIHRVD